MTSTTMIAGRPRGARRPSVGRHRALPATSRHRPGHTPPHGIRIVASIPLLSTRLTPAIPAVWPLLLGAVSAAAVLVALALAGLA